MNTQEFSEMVEHIRIVEQALGTADYELSENSKKSRWAARSLFVCEDMKAGDSINSINVRSIRPGHDCIHAICLRFW